jgi:hypothetical protein
MEPSMSTNSDTNISNLVFLSDDPCLDGYDDDTDDVKCVWNFLLDGQNGELIYRLPEKLFDLRVFGSGKIEGVNEEMIANVVALLPDTHKDLVKAWNEAFENGGIAAATTIYVSSVSAPGF